MTQIHDVPTDYTYYCDNCGETLSGAMVTDERGINGYLYCGHPCKAQHDRIMEWNHAAKVQPNVVSELRNSMIDEHFVGSWWDAFGNAYDVEVDPNSSYIDSDGNLQVVLRNVESKASVIRHKRLPQRSSLTVPKYSKFTTSSPFGRITTPWVSTFHSVAGRPPLIVVPSKRSK